MSSLEHSSNEIDRLNHTNQLRPSIFFNNTRFSTQATAMHQTKRHILRRLLYVLDIAITISATALMIFRMLASQDCFDELFG